MEKSLIKGCEKAIRPNNIGIGTWNKMVSEDIEAVTKTASNISKGVVAGGIAIGAAVGSLVPVAAGTLVVAVVGATVDLVYYTVSELEKKFMQYKNGRRGKIGVVELKRKSAKWSISIIKGMVKEVMKEIIES